MPTCLWHAIAAIPLSRLAPFRRRLVDVVAGMICGISTAAWANLALAVVFNGLLIIGEPPQYAFWFGGLFMGMAVVVCVADKALWRMRRP